MYILYTEPWWQYRLVTGGPLALFDQFFLLLSDGVDSDSLGEMVGGEGGGRVGGEEGGKEGSGKGTPYNPPSDAYTHTHTHPHPHPPHQLGVVEALHVILPLMLTHP